MNIPADLKYAKSDEWIRVEGDTGLIGITDYAQNALSDIVYVEFPSVGDTVTAGKTFGSVESVKAASELNAPVSGEVLATNEDLASAPEVVNSDPYGKGWMVKIKIADASQLTALMDAAAYAKYCEERAH